MATSKGRRGKGQGARLNFPAPLLLATLLFALLPACSSIRPVVKIGLIAPFEGLYRRTGYAALAAMRVAIAEAPANGIDLLPVALDDANDPAKTQRALQKLQVDPSVRALVGPMSYELAEQLAAEVEVGSLLWFSPWAVIPAGGFVDPKAGRDSLTELVAAVATRAQQQGSSRLLLLGGPSSAREPTQWATVAPLTVNVSNDLAIVQASDAVLHLGDPAQAAADLAELRKQQLNVPFYLGLQGEDPVFVERAQLSGPLFWATWVDAGYDDWAAQQGSASPAAYRVYRATQQIIAQLQGRPALSMQRWEVRFYAIDEAGTSRQVDLLSTNQSK